MVRRLVAASVVVDFVWTARRAREDGAGDLATRLEGGSCLAEEGSRNRFVVLVTGALTRVLVLVREVEFSLSVVATRDFYHDEDIMSVMGLKRGRMIAYCHGAGTIRGGGSSRMCSGFEDLEMKVRKRKRGRGLVRLRTERSMVVLIV